MKEYSQKDIDDVWNEAWKKWREVPAATLFKNPLFVEGYRIYRTYLPKEPFTFLEFGAGSGRYGLAVAHEYEKSTVTLTDPLEESVTNMKYSGDSLGLSNVAYEEADMRKVTYHDDTYDVVFADAVIQHIKEDDIDIAMREAYRVLKPGGQLVVSAVNSWNPFHRFYKEFLTLLGREYEYGYERTYSRSELRSVFERNDIPVVAEDGFYVAYGLYRFGYKRPLYKPLSRVINRIVRILDACSGRLVTRLFGFELFCVGTKPHSK
jgi:ubiquinone/menaquinone biosynthesis C-methylase UbiE